MLGDALSLLSAGYWGLRLVFARDAFGRAIRRTINAHYTYRREISKSIHRWRSDDDVSTFLREISKGALRPNVPDKLVFVFIEKCTIPGIIEAKARGIVETFVGALQEERYNEPGGTSILANTQRGEADHIIAEVAQMQHRMHQDMLVAIRGVGGNAPARVGSRSEHLASHSAVLRSAFGR
jgi:hypothetical protein